MADIISPYLFLCCNVIVEICGKYNVILTLVLYRLNEIMNRVSFILVQLNRLILFNLCLIYNHNNSDYLLLGRMKDTRKQNQVKQNEDVEMDKRKY